MTSKKTRHALVSSIISLVLCCSMLIGTTFAWFTDEVTSAGNIIKSGTLDVQLFHGDSAGAITNEITNENAAQSAIFDYKYWEPGYTQTKFVTIKNNGDLAFKFQLNIIPDVVATEGDIDLAKVIDVYMLPADDAAVTREAIAAATPVGTLADLMADADGAAHGILLPKEGVGSTDTYAQVQGPRGEISYAIALKMQESAGNEYQNKTVGGNGFKVQLIATQYTWENDSFDHMYDENADFLPKATVLQTGSKAIDTVNYGEIMANTTFQFLPNETLAEAEKSFYRYYHADFVVSADRDIPEGAVILPGYYKAYADFTDDQRWIGISNDDVEIEAGTEIRLIQVLAEALGWDVTVNYQDICEWGNDGIGFLCGVSDQSKGELAGTTLTVELRLYETTGDPNTTTGDKNKETGEYITIGTYKYTFGDSVVVGNAKQLQKALDNAAPGTTIQLMEGVDYGVVYLRPTANSAVTKEVDWVGNNYRYETYSLFENITIRGAEGATIDAIEIEGGTYYNTEHSQAAQYPVMLSLVELKDVVIDGVTFTGKGGYDPQGYGNVINLSGNNIKVDGLTLQNCVLNDEADNARLIYKTESTTTQHTYTYDGATYTFQPTLKDITVTGCTFNGGYMGLELRETENLTITDNTFNGVTSRDMLLPVNTGCTYSGTMKISGNTSVGAGERFIRATGIGNTTLIITDNTITGYAGADDSYIKVEGVTGTSTVTGNTATAADASRTLTVVIQ